MTSFDVAGLVIVLLTNLALLVQHRRLLTQTGYPYLKLYGTVAQWSSYRRVFSWLEDHSGNGDVVASGLDSMILLYTDAKAFRPCVYRPDKTLYQRSPDEILSVDELPAFLKEYNARYLVRLPMPGFVEEPQVQEAVRQLFNKHPHWLQPVYGSKNSRFVVYEAQSAHEPADPGSRPSGRAGEDSVRHHAGYRCQKCLPHDSRQAEDTAKSPLPEALAIPAGGQPVSPFSLFPRPKQTADS